MKPNIDPILLGKRLAEARKARGMTQEDAAAAIQCSRPTFIAIEKGVRLPKSEEIVRLADLYGRSVHELIRHNDFGKMSFELPPHFRAVAGNTAISQKDLENAIISYQKFTEDYCALEAITDTPLRKNYPPVPSFPDRRFVDDIAEIAAAQERMRLGLGEQPVHDLRNMLEVEVGLRVFYDTLPSRVAGMFSYNDEVGGVIVVNRNHPPERRRLTMMHEYGHLLRDRYKPGIDIENEQPGNKSSEERFADSFAACFLMPKTAIQRYFCNILEMTGDFQIADMIRMAHFFYVSFDALANRLSDLRYIKDGVFDYITRSGKKLRDLKPSLNLPSYNADNRPFSNRYISLAVLAYQDEKLSIGQLASFLRADKVEARNIAQEFMTGGDECLFNEITQPSDELASLLK